MGKDAGHDVGQCRNRAASTIALIDGEVTQLLDRAKVPGRDRVRDLLRKAMSACGLELEEIAELLLCTDPEAASSVHRAARRLKTSIFGKRVVITAELSLQGSASKGHSAEPSWSGEALNSHHASSHEETGDEVREILEEGHKRVTLVPGDSVAWPSIEDAIAATWNARHARASIRRINLRALLTRPEDVRRFRECRGGTLQLYQGTYHLPTFLANSPGCSEFDYGDRLTAPERAMESGATDLGLGVSFGLYDARYEVLALAWSIQRLRRTNQLSPRTIQVSWNSSQEDHHSTGSRPWSMSVSDKRKVISVLRLANPYSGLIVTEKDSSLSLGEMLTLGATQVSLAACGERQRTNVGIYGSHSYSSPRNRARLDEVVRRILDAGFVPSFCTACSHLEPAPDSLEGQAMRGLARCSCLPNALLTLQEYLEDYGCRETLEYGQLAIQQHLPNVRSPWIRKRTKERLERVSTGEPELSY